MYEVKRVAIDKVCWKSKMKDWYYMSEVNVWDGAQNDLNTKYMANKKWKNPTENSLQSHVTFNYTS